MRILLPTLAVALTLALAGCSPAAPSSTAPPEQTPAAEAPSATPTPTSTPTPVPAALAAIEVSVAGLTLAGEGGAVIDELELTEGSAAFEAALTEIFGAPTSTSVDENGDCSAPGTTTTKWAEVGAALKVSPPNEESADPFWVSFNHAHADADSDVIVRIPGGPALGEDAESLFLSLPEDQRYGIGAGSMVYEVAPDSTVDAPWGHHGAAGYLDHEFVLQALMTPASLNSFNC